MKTTTGIDTKALQLTIILLRQYQPKLAKLLPGPENYPAPGTDIDLQLEPENIAKIIDALNHIGDEWLKEKEQRSQNNSPSHSSTKNNHDRDRYRKACLAYVLNAWINLGEVSQQQASILH